MPSTNDTCAHAASSYFDSKSFAPYRARSTKPFASMNSGICRSSTCPMSGPPPAASAEYIFWYPPLLPPGIQFADTWMSGCVLFQTSQTFCRSLSQAQ